MTGRIDGNGAASGRMVSSGKAAKPGKVRLARPDKVRPPMNVGDRAKIFAPFEALGSMEAMLEEEENSVCIGELEHVREPDDQAQERAIWTDLS